MTDACAASTDTRRVVEGVAARLKDGYPDDGGTQMANDIATLLALVQVLPCDTAQPYCLKWATDLPSIAGPYAPEWAAHNECAAYRHVYAAFFAQGSLLLKKALT